MHVADRDPPQRHLAVSERHDCVGIEPLRFAIYRAEVPEQATFRVATRGGYGVFHVTRGCDAGIDPVSSCDSFGPDHGLSFTTREPGTYYVIFGERPPDEGEDPAAPRVSTLLEPDAVRDRRCATAPALPLRRLVEASTRGSEDTFHPSCLEYADGPDDVYRVEVVEPSRLTATAKSHDFNALILSVESSCERYGESVACDTGWKGDDGEPTEPAHVEVVLSPGEHYVVVGSDGMTGRYSLQATLRPIAP